MTYNARKFIFRPLIPLLPQKINDSCKNINYYFISEMAGDQTE